MKPRPKNWETVFEQISAFRKKNQAPVDTMGCERLADSSDPKTFRYEALVSLQLSSQTKDQITAEVVKMLKSIPGGLKPSVIAKMDPNHLDQLIFKVGFHRKKALYMIETAKILVSNYGEDIPKTLGELQKLPGIGPKMAYLCMQVAWSKNCGIGVDTHVHRIANRLGWVNTKSAEETRKALEDWLPSDKWVEINPLLVGFGQVHCLPVKPKCHDCPVNEWCSKGKET